MEYKDLHFTNKQGNYDKNMITESDIQEDSKDMTAWIKTEPDETEGSLHSEVPQVKQEKCDIQEEYDLQYVKCEDSNNENKGDIQMNNMKGVTNTEVNEDMMKGEVKKSLSFYDNGCPSTTSIGNVSIKQTSGVTALEFWKTYNSIYKGEKPHQCDICKKQFAEEGHLNLHKQLHMMLHMQNYTLTSNSHQIGDDLQMYEAGDKEKPHKCDMCGEQFPNTSFIKQHVLSHLLAVNASCSRSHPIKVPHFGSFTWEER